MSRAASITVKNPVLPGFHPDPSICRVEDDFYIATSSFEYYPGVPIHHSRNLQKWELIGHALTRESQLNMRGNPKSGGIWAPCLSHCDGVFYLIFTDVKEWAGADNDVASGFKDTHNYLTTAPDIGGPWSEPIYLNSSGFDPSLFHDDDGRKWFVNMIWDYRLATHSFAGIVLQEYSPTGKRLVGPITNIFAGSTLGVTEAPHLYKRKGWYYLMTAEGGTAYTHAVTLARSRTIDGNYELHPDTHLLTAVSDLSGFNKSLTRRAPSTRTARTAQDSQDARTAQDSHDARTAQDGGNFAESQNYLHRGLQKAGHGSMVPWTENEWVLAHLCGRPLDNTGRCPLGRETALQKIVWKDDGWPYLQGKGASYEVEFSLKNGIVAEPAESTTAATATTASLGKHAAEWREDFDSAHWDIRLNTLRCPADERYSLSARRGWLRLKGAESMVSRFRQSLLLRRVQHFNWSAETCLDFAPESFQQMAGLIIRYDESTQILLRVSTSNGARCLGIIHFDLNRMYMPIDNVALNDGLVHLAVDVKGRDLQLRWRQEEGAWAPIGPVFDASTLSDDYVKPMGFTGTYVGIACFDLSGRSLHADFDYLSYTPTT